MRPMLIMHHPGFSCPLCRTFADLETDVEVEPLPEPITQTKTLANVEEGRPAVVLEDGAGEDLAMRDDELDLARAHLHPDQTRADDDGDAESAAGFEEEVEAMVTSENEREERELSASHSGGSGTRQSSRAREEAGALHEGEIEGFDDDDEEGDEEGHDESGSAGGSGTDLATA